jgi:hypothetical protein
MLTYADGAAGGGCFAADSLVLLSDGRSVKVCDVKVGDSVRTTDGDARIRYVVRLEV